MSRLFHSELILAASIVIGVSVPPLSALLRPGLFVFVFFLMIFSLLTINLRQALPDRNMSAQVFGILGCQMILLPAVIGLWHRFGPWSGTWSELMFITACAGTIFGAPAFARVMRLDAVLTLRGVIAGTLLMPVVLALLAPLVLQSRTGFDFRAYGFRLCIFIVLPIAIAYVYQSRRARAGNDRPGDDRVINGLTIAFLALFGIAVMDGIGPLLVRQPWSIIGMLGFALLVHAVFFGLNALAFLHRGRREALTAGLLSGYRNLAVVLAVGGALLPPDFIVFVALWQVPMYLIPLLIRHWRPPAEPG